jgi:hypothetical protein
MCDLERGTEDGADKELSLVSIVGLHANTVTRGKKQDVDQLILDRLYILLLNPSLFSPFVLIVYFNNGLGG